jgi:hypothetical protein
VDSADEGLFEMREGVFKILPFDRIGCFGAGLVESLTNADLELAGGFVSERDGYDGSDLGFAFRKKLNDTIGELGGLASASGGFDDEGLIEVGANAFAGEGVAGGGCGVSAHTVLSRKDAKLRKAAKRVLRAVLARSIPAADCPTSVPLSQPLARMNRS